jgi:peptidyl-tRNA hydrolase
VNTADTMVQPIILLVDKADPAAHEDAIKAVATASVAAYAYALFTGADLTPWTRWLSGPFTKSVRRADAKTFAKLASAADEDGVPHAVVGKAKALALTPAQYADLPKAISRLQVSGTELPDRISDEEGLSPAYSPKLYLNDALGMSTGKAAAQAAHALFAWFLAAGEQERRDWLAGECRFDLHLAAADEFAELSSEVPGNLLIEDAGRTEIEPGTATAFVQSGIPYDLR